MRDPRRQWDAVAVIVVPLLAAVAFLGPPAAVVRAYPAPLVHLVRPTHARPVVPELRPLRLRWIVPGRHGGFRSL